MQHRQLGDLLVRAGLPAEPSAIRGKAFQLGISHGPNARSETLERTISSLHIAGEWPNGSVTLSVADVFLGNKYQLVSMTHHGGDQWFLHLRKLSGWTRLFKPYTSRWVGSFHLLDARTLRLAG